MANYEQTSNAEVQRLAKLGDKDALYEMAYRIELSPNGQNSPNYEQFAWKAYWMEKAGKAGHIDATRICANTLKNLPFDAECRKKALELFLEYIKNCAVLTGKTEDEEWNLAAVRIEVGIMLCEGLGVQRDHEEGLRLIHIGEEKLNQLGGMVFKRCFDLGNLYAEGFAQKGEEPSIDDLGQAIAYLENAVNRFNSEKDDPRMLDDARELLHIQKERKANKENMKVRTGQESSTINPDVETRRKQLTQPFPEEARQFMVAFKNASQNLRERLAREDW